ncbi:MAG: NAD(P)-dependent oxidoreductase [Rhodospirillaceae bacterium]
MMTKPKIGWIGLGHMGVPMAANLIAAGYPLLAWNRTPERLALLDCPSAASPAALAAEVDVVVTMLSDDAAQEAVLFGPGGVAEGLRAGQVVVNMGTISPGASRSAADRLAKLGVAVLDAPVSGSVKPATEGSLVILVGGKAETFDRCRPIFDVLGKRAFHFGPAGAGARAKLAVNMVLGLTLQALAEAVVLGEKSGLSRDMLLEMLGEAAVASPIVKLKLPAIAAGNFSAAFPLKHMAKDFRLAVAEAAEVGAVLPITATAKESYGRAETHGFGDLDIMAILQALRG